MTKTFSLDTECQLARPLFDSDRCTFFFFLQLKVGDNLFENTVSAMAFAANQSYSLLDKPVDRDKWDYVTS